MVIHGDHCVSLTQQPKDKTYKEEHITHQEDMALAKRLWAHPSKSKTIFRRNKTATVCYSLHAVTAELKL